jgi:hypothetical protein
MRLLSRRGSPHSRIHRKFQPRMREVIVIRSPQISLFSNLGTKSNVFHRPATDMQPQGRYMSGGQCHHERTHVLILPTAIALPPPIIEHQLKPHDTVACDCLSLWDSALSWRDSSPAQPSPQAKFLVKSISHIRGL